MDLPQLRGAGLPGLLEAIGAKNHYSPSIAAKLRNGGPALDRAYRSFHSAIDSYLTGDPIALADLQARIIEFSSLAHALAEAADELAQLVSTHSGTPQDEPAREPGDPKHEIKSAQKKRAPSS
jgi:hypothetical protein